MKIYLIERTDEIDYDEYDSAVVCAKNEESAKRLGPTGEGDGWGNHPVTVTLIGQAERDSGEDVILSSFNAG